MMLTLFASTLVNQLVDTYVIVHLLGSLNLVVIKPMLSVLVSRNDKDLATDIFIIIWTNYYPSERAILDVNKMTQSICTNCVDQNDVS